MAMKISCSVVTPDKVLYKGDVDFAVVQAYDGERGFLYNHIPLVSQLGYGEVRLYTGDVIERLIVEGGIVEIRENELIVLAEDAMLKKELSKDEIQKRLTELSAIEKPRDFGERELINFEIKKMKARLKVATV
jgi:F-type H+-transporting ATPase subunit epsilon